jgi:hypothetical protein
MFAIRHAAWKTGRGGDRVTGFQFIVDALRLMRVKSLGTRV